MSDESNDDQIRWVTLKLEFPDAVGAELEKIAQDAGMPLKCYCIHVLMKHALNNASPEERERWQQQLPATLRRNGCEESALL